MINPQDHNQNRFIYFDPQSTKANKMIQALEKELSLDMIDQELKESRKKHEDESSKEPKKQSKEEKEKKAVETGYWKDIKKVQELRKSGKISEKTFKKLYNEVLNEENRSVKLKHNSPHLHLLHSIASGNLPDRTIFHPETLQPVSVISLMLDGLSSDNEEEQEFIAQTVKQLSRGKKFGRAHEAPFMKRLLELRKNPLGISNPEEIIQKTGTLTSSLTTQAEIQKYVSKMGEKPPYQVEEFPLETRQRVTALEKQKISLYQEGIDHYVHLDLLEGQLQEAESVKNPKPEQKVQLENIRQQVTALKTTIKDHELRVNKAERDVVFLTEDYLEKRSLEYDRLKEDFARETGFEIKEGMELEGWEFAPRDPKQDAAEEGEVIDLDHKDNKVVKKQSSLKILKIAPTDENIVITYEENGTQWTANLKNFQDECIARLLHPKLENAEEESKQMAREGLEELTEGQKFEFQDQVEEEVENQPESQTDKDKKSPAKKRKPKQVTVQGVDKRGVLLNEAIHIPLKNTTNSVDKRLPARAKTQRPSKSLFMATLRRLGLNVPRNQALSARQKAKDYRAFVDSDNGKAIQEKFTSRDIDARFGEGSWAAAAGVGSLAAGDGAGALATGAGKGILDGSPKTAEAPKAPKFEITENDTGPLYDQAADKFNVDSAAGAAGTDDGAAPQASESDTKQASEDASEAAKDIDWVGKMDHKSEVEALPYDQVHKHGGMKVEKQSWLASFWSNTHVLSIDDLWELGKTGYEYYVRRWERKQKEKYASVAEDVPYFSPEMKRIKQAAENEEVNQYKESFSQMGVHQIQGILGKTRNKDELKAAFMDLSDKGQLRWDDIDMWRNLNRFVAPKYAIPIPSNGDPNNRVSTKDTRTGFDFHKAAIDSLWGEGTYDSWYSGNKGAYESGAQKWGEEGKELEGVEGGHARRLATLLQMHMNGEFVDPQRFEGLILHSITAGKTRMHAKVYYIIMGAAMKNKYGRTILSFDRVAHINSEKLVNFPLLEYICAGVDRPGGGSHRYTIDDYTRWAHMFDEGDGKYLPGQKCYDFLWNYVLPSDQTENRINKAMRGAEGIDHDDMFGYVPPASETIITDLTKSVGGGSKRALTIEGYANALPGFSHYFRSLAGMNNAARMAEAVKSFIRFESIMNNRYKKGQDSYARLDWKTLNSATIVSDEPPQQFIDEIKPILREIVVAYQDQDLVDMYDLTQTDSDAVPPKQRKALQNQVQFALEKFGVKFTEIVSKDGGQKMLTVMKKNSHKLTGMDGYATFGDF